MAAKYGATLRNDPNPALEQLVAPPIRQTNQQRVIETATNFEPVSCSAYRATSTSFSAGVATTVSWTDEVFDTHTLHDNAVNNSRFTIPTNQPGVYRINSRIALDVSGGGTYTQVEIRVLVNGVEVADEFTGTITVNTPIMISHEQQMLPGDYYEIQILMTGADPALTLTPGVDNTYAVVTKQLV
jgi:hypothetical protein